MWQKSEILMNKDLSPTPNTDEELESNPNSATQPLKDIGQVILSPWTSVSSPIHVLIYICPFLCLSLSICLSDSLNFSC